MLANGSILTYGNTVEVEVEKERSPIEIILSNNGTKENMYETITLNASMLEKPESVELKPLNTILENRHTPNELLQNMPAWRRDAFLTETHYTANYQNVDLNPCRPFKSNSRPQNVHNTQAETSAPKIVATQTNPNAKPYLKTVNRVRIVENELFMMVFDLPTPRPHFIILHKSAKKPGKKTVRDLDDTEIMAILSLIEVFKTKYNLTADNFILSFHTGYWVII